MLTHPVFQQFQLIDLCHTGTEYVQLEVKTFSTIALQIWGQSFLLAGSSLDLQQLSSDSGLCSALCEVDFRADRRGGGWLEIASLQALGPTGSSHRWRHWDTQPLMSMTSRSSLQSLWWELTSAGFTDRTANILSIGVSACLLLACG